jgi:hypothetical protein
MKKRFQRQIQNQPKKAQFISCVFDIGKLLLLLMQKEKKSKTHEARKKIYTNCVCNICKVLLLLLLFIAKTKSKSSKQARKHAIMLCDIC